MFRKRAISVALSVVLSLALALLVAAQQAPQPAQPAGKGKAKAAAVNPNPAAVKPTGPQGTLSGIVVQKGSKTPIEGAEVALVGSLAYRLGAQSNPEGKFEMKVPPDGYQITVRLRGQSGYIGVPTVKVVTVRVDEVTKTEIEVPQAAELTGRVLDARGEPVQGARVNLLLRTYEFWSTNLVYLNTSFMTQTNDIGEYFFEGIPAGIGFHVFAEIVTPGTAEALSTNAADPDQRRPILAGTFYPQSTDAGGGQAITLGEGERRERADIRMVQTKSYCVEDKLLPVPPGDVQYTVNVDLTGIVSGVFNGTGSFRNGRIVSLDKEGKMRVCGLWPGSYRFTVQPQNRGRVAGTYYGGGQFIITDKDLTSLGANVAATFDWNGEVFFDGPAPAQPIEQRMQVSLGNVTPTSVSGGVQTDIPGKFTLPNLHLDRELLMFNGLPDGWYVKSAMYGNEELTLVNGRFTLHTPGVPLRLVVDPKGSRIKVKVIDDKGQPVPATRVNLIPSRLNTAQQLVGRMWSCYSDYKGECMVFTPNNEPPKPVLAPGEYTVLAAELPYNQSADVLDQVWKTIQTEGTKVRLQPGATGEVSIKQVVLR